MSPVKNLLKTLYLNAEVDVFAQTGDSDRKPVWFLVTKDKTIPFGRQRWCFSFECLKKITLARFCYKNVFVTIANKPIVKYRLKGKAKNFCMQFCRTALCEPA